MANIDQYQAPWEKPNVKLITSIFNGKIVNVKQTDKINVELTEGMGSYGRGEM